MDETQSLLVRALIGDLSPEQRSALVSALAGEDDQPVQGQPNKAEAERQAEEERRAALGRAYKAEIESTPRGINGVDARQRIKREFALKGYVPVAGETGLQKLRAEESAWLAAHPAPAAVTTSPDGTTTSDSLLSEYRLMTAGVPTGEAGVQKRFEAKRAIRERAKQAGINSPV